MSVPPPRFLFVLINKRCNLKCLHCDFWTLHDADKDNYLSNARRYEIMSDYAGMTPGGRVVICGGEPMLDLETFFDVSASSRKLGLRCLAVVNGTRIRTPDMAQRLVSEGPHEISISLNSHRSDLHDKTRGVDGAFEKAVKAIRLLIAAREANPSSGTRIIVMGLIYKDNYRDIEDFYDFVLNDLKADALKLNFIQPKFGQASCDDPFFADETDVDPDLLKSILTRCDAKFGLGFNPLWIEQAGMYFRSVAKDGSRTKGWGSDHGTDEHICNSYERNVMVDHYGMARLCFSTRFPGRVLQKPGDLGRFWEEAGEIRKCMKNCNAYCGISHSVRREASTVAGNQYRFDHAAQYGSLKPSLFLDKWWTAATGAH